MRLKRSTKRAMAWAVIFEVELISAAIPTALTALILIPVANAWRGYSALGGEWLAIGAVFYICYCQIHACICNAVFGKEERKNAILHTMPVLRKQSRPVRNVRVYANRDNGPAGQRG